MKIRYVPIVLLLSVCQQTIAAVTEKEAAQLGVTLTPLGAIKAGNAKGTIPPWTGLTVNAAPVDAKGILTDPYAKEQPLFTITAANVGQYSQFLTVGQVEMFKRYPTTFKMNVYPSHRTATVPDAINAAARLNAVKTKLTNNNNTLEDFKDAYPFPIPKNGLEVVWNHLAHYRGNTVSREVTIITPQANGSFTPSVAKEEFIFKSGLKPNAKNNNVLQLYKYSVVPQGKKTNEAVLIRETLDQVDDPRMAWSYDAAQKRVRRAPQIAFDGPALASDKLRNADDIDMLNGSPSRYNWQLVGKKEIYVPYNNYKLDSASLKYRDIIRAGHINPDYVRYELHRVWHVIGTLKAGQKHAYPKRELFIDEDSWRILHADIYDNKNQIWRVADSLFQQYYNKQVPWSTADIIHDLPSGRYIIHGLKNEQKTGYKFGTPMSETDFTPAALQRLGAR